jgi:hypothetical protein
MPNYTIGFDIAKNVFQVHGVDAAEKVIVRSQLRRSQEWRFYGASSWSGRRAKHNQRSPSISRRCGMVAVDTVTTVNQHFD